METYLRKEARRHGSSLQVVNELKRDASERISLKDDASESATSEEVKNEETLAH